MSVLSCYHNRGSLASPQGVGVHLCDLGGSTDPLGVAAPAFRAGSRRAVAPLKGVRQATVVGIRLAREISIGPSRRLLQVIRSTSWKPLCLPSQHHIR